MLVYYQNIYYFGNNKNLLAELKNRLKISIFLWIKKVVHLVDF